MLFDYRKLARIASVVLVTIFADVASANEETGRRLLEEAIRARESGQLRVAERLMRASLEEYRWSYTAFQLAELFRETDRPADAMGVLEAVLAGEYGETADQARQAVNAALEEQQETVPRLRIRSNVTTDVEVELRGEPVPYRMEDGALVVRLNPGAHVLTVSATGYQSAEVRVEAQMESVVDRSVELAEATGRLIVEVSSTAVVHINDDIVTTPIDLELPVGTHRIRVVDGSDQQERNVDVTLDGVVRLDLRGVDNRRRRRWIGGILGAAAGIGLVIGGVFLFRPDNSLPVDFTDT